MGALEWLGLRGPTEQDNPLVSELSESLRQEQETNLLLQESIADLELASDDAGWQRIASQGRVEFTRGGLGQIAALCQLMAIANPLIKRGLNLRIFYVWGLGLQVMAPANGQNIDNASEQDVNAVVQDFLDDPSNRGSLTGESAHEELERALGTDGNVFLSCWTAPLTGRVQIRSLPFLEITDIISNPDDSDEPWYYKRVRTVSVVDYGSGGVTQDTVTTYHPDLRYRPRVRPRTIGSNQVLWDAPVLHVPVNRLDGWKFGVPDAYAAISWARHYKEFLEDWATLVKALSRFAWKTSTPGSKVSRSAARIAQAPATDPRTGESQRAGATAVVPDGTKLDAIPKTGATIDAESGRPLAMMVASALDVPVTMLMEDPGQVGARATAETLDLPTELMASMRRARWTEVYVDLLSYVIDQAVKAPRGPLKGTISRDENGRETTLLAGDTDRTVEVTWPPLDETPIDVLVKAIAEADLTGKLPPLVVARLLLQALGVDNVDEILEELTDEEGNFVDPGVSAGQVAVDAFRDGRDPAAVVGDAQPPVE